MILTAAQRKRIAEIAKGRSDEGLYVLEGRRAVRDALETGVVAEVWLRKDENADTDPELTGLARDAGVPVGAGGKKDFERMGGTVSPQGVLALVRDTSRPLDEVAALPGMLLWLDGVQDPANVGAIVRVAVAFGASGILIGEGTAHPLGFKALRASTGLALRVPFARGGADAIVEALAGRPAWILDKGGQNVFAPGRVPADFVFVVGAEGRGPGEVARAAAARVIGIPIEEGVDSLNAAVAAGIACAALRHAR